ncbi:MAG: four helix bundle protein [Bacteroidota bacterium]
MNEKDNIIKIKSFQFAIRVINLYKHLCSEKKEFVISKQLLRSGTSIGANVREAVNAQSKPDFIYKLSIAQKECDETSYWLELLKETDYINESEYISIHNDAMDILKIIRSIILTTKQNIK